MPERRVSWISVSAKDIPLNDQQTDPQRLDSVCGSKEKIH
jgi:hypothetical protein